jgi:transcriptional regulator with XRE-family HTH domain
MRERRTLALEAGFFSYNVHMTDEEFWRDVGRFLRDHRESQGKPVRQIAGESDLDADTVKAIERGQPARIDKFRQLLHALGLSTVDVLHAVLRPVETRPTLEAAALMRCFEQLDVEARSLVLWTARKLAPPQADAAGPTLVPAPPRKRPPTK